MKKRILIENFGPVKRAEVDLNKNLQIFIGAQASGKSTICKTVYFCQKLRDYTLDFIMDVNQLTQNHVNEYFNNYMKFLTGKFMGCFGTTKHMREFRIEYLFGTQFVKIHLNHDGYVRFRFDELTKQEVSRLMFDASSVFLTDLQEVKAKSLLDDLSVLGAVRRNLKNSLGKVFGSDMDVMYIPAGRSLLATMSEQLQEVSLTAMDLTMQEFIGLIRATKNKFGFRIPEMVQNYTKTVKGQINNSAVEQAYELIRNILKADYTSESDGEKMYFDEYHWVKLMYGSSGQQEVLWILMLVFAAILEKNQIFVVIEEPEAHLFPTAQRDVVSLVALLVNITGSQVIITTHSPYILTSINILLLSDRIENSRGKQSGTVIPKNLRVLYDYFAAYQIEPKDNTMKSLLDDESHMINTDYIDEVSSITNKDLDQLITMGMSE